MGEGVAKASLKRAFHSLKTENFWFSVFSGLVAVWLRPETRRACPDQVEVPRKRDEGPHR